jgi:hypothetical protein
MLHSLLQFSTEEMTTKTQLFEFLYETCKKNDGVLVDTLHNYISSLDEVELVELEDFLTNNFGDN